MKQSIHWLESTKTRHLEYYTRQIEKPYRSTISFCQWLETLGLLSKNREDIIADIGAGAGGNIYYMARKYKKSTFVGIDINPTLVEIGNKYFKESGQCNCKLLEGDLYALDKCHIGKYDGIVSYQTLSWLPDYKLAIKKMVELKTGWIAITSLFYDGDVNCKIIVQDYTIPLAGKPYQEAFYNIYCLRLVQELLAKYGYSKFSYKPFEIDIDLPKPKTTGMGTYTKKLANGKRLQISGPLLMSWYFILAKK